MSTSPLPERLPFSAVPDVALLVETDELLDRLAARAPRGVDLDDPVLASLAVLAGDVDLDPAPFEPTRRVARGYGLRVEDHPGLTRLGPVALEPPTQPLSILAQEVEARPASGVPATLGPRRAARAREQAHDGRRTAGFPPVRVPEQPSRAAGRVWQSAETGPAGSRRRAWRHPRTTIRTVPALAAAGAALVLSMSAAAALTSGESVNPATALAQVVRQISGGTAEYSPPESVGSSVGQPQGGGGAGPASPSASLADPSAAGAEPDSLVSPTASPDPAVPSAGGAVVADSAQVSSDHQHWPTSAPATGSHATGGPEAAAAAGPAATVPPVPPVLHPETEAPTWPSAPAATTSASSPEPTSESSASAVTSEPAVVSSVMPAAPHVNAAPKRPKGKDGKPDERPDRQLAPTPVPSAD